MLIDTMFELKSLGTDGNRIEATLGIITESPIYKAHFPQRPITPGVCIIQIVQEVIEKACNTKLLLANARNVKFLNTLSPDSTTEVSLSIEYDPTSLSANAVMKNNDTMIAKMTLNFRQEAKSHASRSLASK